MNVLSAFLGALTAPFRWLLKIPLGLFSAPRRLVGLSLPVRVAVIVGLFLLICAICALVAMRLTRDAVDWWLWVWRWETAAAGVLIVVIPLLVYTALRLWLEGDVSRYPDIDEAWQAGLEALRANRLDLDTLPVFLVLGAGSWRGTEALMDASGLDFIVRCVPEGRAPLYWYAHSEAAYVVCNDIGLLGRLNAAVAVNEPVSSPVPAAQNIRGTIVPQRGAAGTGRSESPPAFGGGVGGLGVGSIKGTLVPGAAPAGATPAAAAVGPSTDVTKREAKEQTSRLDYLCELLIRARQPLCPLNGVLTLLPLVVLRSTLGARNLSTAVQEDLETISARLRLRFPVTTLVTGMEAEPGFAELVRRVGVGQAGSHRFGKGYEVWNPPTAENLDAFSLHACGAFEDWVYNLFLEPGAVDNPGNADLYTLLCTVRSDIRPRLRSVLIHGFSSDAADRRVPRLTNLFAGCYFAATGAADEERAFVKSVFQKIEDLEEELEWHDDAVREDRHSRHAAHLLVFVNGLLLLGITGLVVYRFFFSK